MKFRHPGTYRIEMAACINLRKETVFHRKTMPCFLHSFELCNVYLYYSAGKESYPQNKQDHR